MNPLEMEFETVPKSIFGYIEGKKFEMKVKIKNPSGGFVHEPILNIQIKWPNGQIVNEPISIKELKPEQEKSFTITTDALSGGYPLFYAICSVGHASGHGRDMALIYQVKSGKKTELRNNVSFHSFYVKSGEELNSFLALIFAIISSMISAIGLVLAVLL